MRERTEQPAVFDLDRVSVMLDGQEILKSITACLPHGGTVAALGCGGAGKTTLLRTLCGLVDVVRGTLKFRGIPLEQWRRSDFLAQIGVTFQRGGLFDAMTAAENVRFALVAKEPHMRRQTKEATERVHEALEAVGLGGRGPLFPYEMSGGMQKRLGIARALVCRPQLLLLDEPTAGLDPVTGEGILQTLAAVRDRHAMSAVVVTNDLDQAASICDRAWFLSEGQVVFDGPLAQLRENSNSEIREFVRCSSWQERKK